jgi:magnesium chelatase family protein
LASDPPIAIGLLAARGTVPVDALDGLWAVGELGLGGDLRGVRGVLATALAARAAGARLLLVPRDNLGEAALVPGVRVAGAASLGQVGEWLRGDGELDAPGRPERVAAEPAQVEDLADVRGQPLARRAPRWPPPVLVEPDICNRGMAVSAGSWAAGSL